MIHSSEMAMKVRSDTLQGLRYDTLRVKICGQRHAVAKVASGYYPGSHLDRQWFESSIVRYKLKYGENLPVGTTVLNNWELCFGHHYPHLIRGSHGIVVGATRQSEQTNTSKSRQEKS